LIIRREGPREGPVLLVRHEDIVSAP
jgi:hypothetical protein